MWSDRVDDGSVNNGIVGGGSCGVLALLSVALGAVMGRWWR